MNVSWLNKMVNVFGQQFISLGKSKVSILGYAQFFISNYVKYLNCFFLVCSSSHSLSIWYLVLIASSVYHVAEVYYNILFLHISWFEVGH